MNSTRPGEFFHWPDAGRICPYSCGVAITRTGRPLRAPATGPELFGLLRRPASGLIVSALLQFGTACYSYAPIEGDPNGALLQTWGAGAVLLVSFSFVWRGLVPRLNGPFVANLLLQVAAFEAAVALTGHGLLDGLWVIAGNIVQAVVVATIYRAFIGRDNWAPRSIPDLGVLLIACLAGSAISTPLGAWPGLAPTQAWSSLAGWWIIRGAMDMAIGVIALLLLCHSELDRYLRVPWPWFQLLLLPGLYGANYVMFHWPQLPMAWIVILHAVWAGLVLTPRLAGLFAAVISIATAVVGYEEGRPWHRDELVGSGLVVDALSLTCVCLVAMLPLVRAQRARLNAQVVEQGALLSTIFESMADGVVVSNGDNQVAFVNDSAAQLLGRRLPEDTPTSWTEYFGATDVDGRAVSDDQLGLHLTALTGEPIEVDIAVPTANNGRRFLRLVVRRFAPDDSRVVAVISDITSRRLRQRELMNFAGMVAHDLKNPMTAAHGWLETARDALAENDLEAAAWNAGRADQAMRRLGQVVDGWLTYSVSRNGSLNPVPVRIDTLTRDVVAGLPPVEAGLMPRFTVEADHAVLADNTLARELLANLVGNAIKYTHPEQTPHVELHSRRVGDLVEVCVRDYGLGITPGEEEQIFEEFHRSPGVRDGFQGTGLGLATCKMIVHRHGGTIRAERADGGGTRMVFTLPAA